MMVFSSSENVDDPLPASNGQDIATWELGPPPDPHELQEEPPIEGHEAQPNPGPVNDVEGGDAGANDDPNDGDDLKPMSGRECVDALMDLLIKHPSVPKAAADDFVKLLWRWGCSVNHLLEQHWPIIAASRVIPFSFKTIDRNWQKQLSMPG